MSEKVRIKEEYLNHQFFSFFESIIENNIIDLNIDTTIFKDKIDVSIFETAVYNQCFNIVMYLSLKTLVLDINMFSEKYTDKEIAYFDYLKFLKSRDGIKSFFEKYKGLRKQIVREINYFTESSKIFGKRFYKDFNLFKNKFGLSGKVYEFEFSQGDSHCHKQSVIRIAFEEKTIFYKPQNSNAIKIISDINLELEKDSISAFNVPYTLYQPEGYCWQEEVTYCMSTESEAKYVYRQYGTLACLAYVFNITDLHMNNLIVHKEKLYLIDVETFLQRNTQKKAIDNSLTMEVYEKIKNTVLSTGLFPIQFKKYKDVDLSGICGKGNQVVDKGKYEIINKNRGDMNLVKKKYYTQEGMNRVTIENRIVDPRDYAKEILYGFELCYRYLLLKEVYFSRILSKYDELYTRLIYRNTSDYAKFLLAGTNPKYIASSEHRKDLFSMLKKSEDFIDKIIIEYEISDLIGGDIPYFTVDMNGNIYNSSHVKISKLSKTENMCLDDRLKKLSYDDLDFQIELMEISLAKPEKKWESDTTGNKCFEDSNDKDMDEELLLEEAKYIFDDSIKNGIQNKDELTWIGIDITESEQWVVSPIDYSLYNGLIGNAIAFLYIYDITKNKKYYDMLNKIVSSITNIKNIWESEDYSVFLGKGGFLYLYYILWKKLNNPKYESLFWKEIDNIKKLDLKTQNLDYISGVSGLLVVLCNIYENEKNDILYKIIVNISEYIISKKDKKADKYVWYSDIDCNEILNGLSHGLSGIAYSLIKSWKITKKEEYCKVALSAIDFENTRKKDGNWIDFRNYERRKELKFREPVYWCHGAAGIGMVRSKIDKIIKENSIKNDLSMAIETVLKKGCINSDCLCHGKFGNLELLMLEDDRTKDVEFHKEIASKILRIINNSNNVWKSGVPQEKRIFTLMLGEVGIAYQLMRFYSYYEIPSILMLDVPKV
ncbi:type 2 lanthipeptide synthetase LanM family protein [Clostridioides difficile]